MLGVSRNTLYAYVSLGLVRSTEHPSLAKASLYVAADVQGLVARKTKMRRPRAAAATALDFGLPVLKTKLTHFEDDRLYYRSEDAIAFSQRATLEETRGCCARRVRPIVSRDRVRSGEGSRVARDRGTLCASTCH